jgi:branched-chain amino acid transport system ATP-binding protein
MSILSVDNLTVHYKAVLALDRISMSVDEGQIVALIGPNGAGKSTALKAIAGCLDYYGGHISGGTIDYDGRDITATPVHELCRRGLALMPEGRRVFGGMTVRDNLLSARLSDRDSADDFARVLDLFEVLRERLDQRAATLSGGEQQMLALARALLLKPRVLLADEPSVGLSPNYVRTIFDKLSEINSQGTTIVLAEQNARMALKVCHRAYVFTTAAIKMDGSSQELIENPEVQRAFLGG